MKITQLRIIKEGLWWLLAIVVGLIVFMPFLGSLVVKYYSFAFFAFLLMSWNLRLTIQFTHVPYLQQKAIRVILFILNIGLLLILISQLNTFIGFFDNRDISFFWQDDKKATAPELYNTFSYFKNVFLLSTVGAIISTLTLEMRLLGYFLGWKRTKIRDRVVYKNNIY